MAERREPAGWLFPHGVHETCTRSRASVARRHRAPDGAFDPSPELACDLVEGSDVHERRPYAVASFSRMDFDMPPELTSYLAELDDFIEKEIRPLEQADDN